jgi:nitrogen regulatory protein PII
MIYARIVCKPFRINNIPENIIERFYYEEVLGLGYHPETYKAKRRALLSGLPRIAIDGSFGDRSEIESVRQSLRTGERGDGKIFVLPVERVVEF